VLQPQLLLFTAPALCAATGAAVVFAIVLAWRRKPDAEPQQTAEFRNPFGFWSVVGLALVLAAIILLGRAAGETFGAAGAVVALSWPERPMLTP
jgi:uncharacterized membrane protein (DUF4010 family)